MASAEHARNKSSKASDGSRFGTCPVCGRLVALHAINSHVDDCIATCQSLDTQRDEDVTVGYKVATKPQRDDHNLEEHLLQPRTSPKAMKEKSCDLSWRHPEDIYVAPAPACPITAPVPTGGLTNHTAPAGTLSTPEAGGSDRKEETAKISPRRPGKVSFPLPIPAGSTPKQPNQDPDHQQSSQTLARASEARSKAHEPELGHIEAQPTPQASPPLPLFPIFKRSHKKIHLIRHGQTAARSLSPWPGDSPAPPPKGPTINGQAAAGPSWITRGVFDLPLSEYGKKSAQALSARIDALRPQVFITSPLTRALQTTEAALNLPQCAPKFSVEVVALHAEHVATPGDVGRRVKVLAAEFPWASFDGLPDVWWFTDPGEKGSTTEDGRGERVERSSSSSSASSSSSEAWSRESMAHLRSRVGAFRDYLSARPETVIAVMGHSTFFRELTNSKRRMEHCEIVTIHL